MSNGGGIIETEIQGTIDYPTYMEVIKNGSKRLRILDQMDTLCTWSFSWGHDSPYFLYVY